MSAEAMLREFVERCAVALPGRILSAYLEGSAADGTDLATSDLDGTVIFRGRLTDAERATMAQLLGDYGRGRAIELDIELTDEQAARRGISPMLKEAGRLVWGEEIRDRLPVVPLTDWTRDRLHSSYWRAAKLFGRATPVRLPLDYPDPADEFFGYCRRPVRLPDGTAIPSTRDLIRHVGWAATGLIALHAGRYVARKRDCHRLYAEVIGGEWASLLADIYEQCHGLWAYRLPDDVVGRAALRAICARTLGFENHFLGIYRQFLLSELRGDDEAGRALTRCMLADIPLADEEIAAALMSAQGMVSGNAVGAS